MTLNLTAEEKIARRKEYKKIHARLYYHEIKETEPEKYKEIKKKANEKAKEAYRKKHNITDESTMKKQKRRNFKVVLEDKEKVVEQEKETTD